MLFRVISCCTGFSPVMACHCAFLSARVWHDVGTRIVALTRPLPRQSGRITSSHELFVLSEEDFIIVWRLTLSPLSLQAPSSCTYFKS